MKSFLRELFKWIILLFFASLLAFFVVRITPSSPIAMYLELLHLPATSENQAILVKQFGFDRPIYIQYANWITDFFKGDWGTSFYFKLPLREEFLRCLPVSVIIGLGGIFTAAFLAFFLGYGVALKPSGCWDKLSRGLVLFNQIVPTFILAIIIVYVLSVKFKIFPMFTGSYAPRLVIGVFLVAIAHVGSLSRVVGEHFRGELKKTYMKAYMVRGISPDWALLRYGSMPAIYGLISAMIEKFSWAIGGTAVVEIALSLPGISSFLVSSIALRDYFVLQAYILVMAIWMFLVHVFLNAVLYGINRRHVYED